MSNRDDLAFRIKEKAHELGFDSCGMTDVSPFGEFLSHVEMRAERFPQSKPLYDKIKKLAHPRQNVDWAKSIIVSGPPSTRPGIRCRRRQALPCPTSE